MAIKVRRGLKEEFISEKLLPGEFAVATDTGSAWYCYNAGKVLLLATGTDIEVIRQEAVSKQEENDRTLEKLTESINEKFTSVENEIALTKQDIEKMKNEVLLQMDSKLRNIEDEIVDVENEIREIRDEQNSLQLLLNSKIDDAYVENGYLYMTSNNEVIVGPLGPFSGTGGGGGGGSNNAVLTMQNTSGWLSKSIATGAVCEISATWSSIEDELPTGNGTLKITINGITKTTQDVAQGTVTIDVGKWLSAGANKIKFNITDAYGNSRTINYSVSVVDVSIASTFDSSIAYSSAINYSYIPTGNIEKTVHFIVDNAEIGTSTVAASGRQQSYTIPAQKHGAHSLLVYFTAEVDGVEIKSNELFYDIICIESGNDTPVITSDFRITKAEQYQKFAITYYVYNPVSMTSNIELIANDETVANLTVDRTKQIWSYRIDLVGALALKIKCGDTVKEFEIEVAESSMNIEAETQDLALYLSSYNRNNNEETPGTWEYKNISATFENFNFSSDGWQLDEDKNTVLRVAGDARLTIPYKIFEKDFRSSGKTIELEFATRDVMNYDAKILSCMSAGRGIELTAQKALMQSEQTTISTQYKENEHVRISFVVEKSVENRLVYCYINGIISGAIQYPTNDDFSQMAAENIVIGSNDCVIDLYCIRVYDNDLTRFQILNNWIADTQDVDDMLERYENNNVFDEYGQIVISQLRKDLPYLVIECPELPQYKGDKKTVSGYYVDPTNSANNFTFENAIMDVQGTSSQYYARKNYKINFKGGFILVELKEESSTYKISADAIPTKIFTFKADVASSEGANNVELVRLYNDICPYKTPPQKTNSKIRQGIDGFPIVMFWNNGNNTTFLGKYNFNNDKGTEEVYGFETGDESWEILNNTSSRVLWKNADFSTNEWLNDFEGRYPDGNTDSIKLSQLSTWIASTDQDAATGQTLSAPVTYADVTYTTDTAEYRLAKFKAELSEYIELESACFYYLFTELFLMVDSRAKNMFPTIFKERTEQNG